MNRTVHEIERQNLREEMPEFSIGDTVDVHMRITEGEKERIQVFNGTVIKRKGSGTRETFTVRRIVQGEGVERTFPIQSPKLVKVAVRRRGRVRRAKLYYLRERVGKKTRVREKQGARPE
jgi:large subunit ribosomal protein L19